MSTSPTAREMFTIDQLQPGMYYKCVYGNPVKYLMAGDRVTIDDKKMLTNLTSGELFKEETLGLIAADSQFVLDVEWAASQIKLLREQIDQIKQRYQIW